MDYLKNKFPSIKIPKLKNFHTDLLSHRSNVVNRITCNWFSSQLPDTNQPHSPANNILERRTIQSTHISTISSLVDTTKAFNSMSHHENQKDNYGLYALKCSRNAAKRTGIIMNITTSNDLNQTVYEIKHEQFHPCQSGGGQDLHCVNYARNEREFYQIEFNEEGVPSHHVGNRRTVRAKPTVQVGGDGLKRATIGQTLSGEAYKCIDGQIIENKGCGKSTAPLPPRRVRSYVRKSTAVTAVASSRDSSSGTDEKPSPASQPSNIKHIPSTISYKLHQRIVGNPLPIVGMQHAVLHAVPPTPIEIEPSPKELTKNDSQLYRIISSKESDRFEERHQSAVNELKPTKSTPDVSRTRPPANKRHSSSDDSVNIFRPKSTENVFDDFDEIFSVEPVHNVQPADEPNDNDTNRKDKTAFNYCLNKTRVGFASAKNLSRKKLFRRSDQSKSQKKSNVTECSSSSSPHLSSPNNNDIEAGAIRSNSYHHIYNDNAITNDGSVDADLLSKRTSITDNFIKHSAQGDFCRHDDYYNDDCNHDINFNNEIEYYSQLNKYNENVVTV